VGKLLAEAPMLQAIDVKRIAGTVEKFRLCISDGSHYITAVVSPKLNALLRELQPNGTLKVTDGVCSIIAGKRCAPAAKGCVAMAGGGLGVAAGRPPRRAPNCAGAHCAVPRLRTLAPARLPSAHHLALLRSPRAVVGARPCDPCAQRPGHLRARARLGRAARRRARRRAARRGAGGARRDDEDAVGARAGGRLPRRLAHRQPRAAHLVAAPAGARLRHQGSADRPGGAARLPARRPRWQGADHPDRRRGARGRGRAAAGLRARGGAPAPCLLRAHAPHRASTHAAPYGLLRGAT
jgi:hypothetical protein